MKRIKLLPSVLMLALCIGILGIGIYAANPTNNVISGTITVTAANAGIKVEVFEGQDTTGTRLGYAEGRTTTTIPIGEVEIDASNALTLEDVPTKYYTIKFSTTSTHKFIVDTETVQLIDGKVTETQETKEDAIIITKNHKKYLEDTESGLEYFTADIKDGETITTDNSYLITIAIRLGELPEQAFGATLNMQFDVHKLTDWVEAGNTGINGIDYLHYGEYPQTLAATSLDGYTKLQDANSEYVTFAAYDDATGGKTTRDVYTDGTANYVAIDSNLYKIEPLKWNILERDKTTGRAKLMCDTIVEQVRFQYNYASGDGTYYAKDYAGNFVLDGSGNKVKANNYEYSLLRNFLIDTFYNSAFNASEKAVMLKEVVDNTTTTETGTSANANACADTEDWIFAPSWQDMVGSYGHSSEEYDYDATRCVHASEYAQATGVAVWYQTEDDMHRDPYNCCGDSYDEVEDREGVIQHWINCYGLSEDVAEEMYEVAVDSGFWWLRSLDSDNAFDARFVDDSGYVFYGSVNYDGPGCVPALLLGL